MRIASLVFVFCALAAAQTYDTILRGGRIVDGTGSPWYSGDVGIRDAKIAAIGDLSAARANSVIDVHGQIVAPGFIDMLGQSETTILVDPHLPSKIYQGITTEVTGEGGSIAPLTPDLIRIDAAGWDHYHVHPDWKSFSEYFARLERQGMGINLASYVGATQVRRVVIGDADRKPDAAELARMTDLVEQAMRDGASGLSTSLEYAPAPYASTEELIALAKAASKYRRHLCDAHAQRRLERFRGHRRSGAHRTRSQYSRRNLAFEGGWRRQLRQNAPSDLADRSGAPRRRRCHRRHLRLYRLVQHVLGVHSAVGARWRRREARRTPEGSGDPRADTQGDDDAFEAMG